MRFHFAFDSTAGVEQAYRAFTDFSDRRPHIWRETLDPAKYHVEELGESWALVREGTRRPDIWALERYDFAPPGTVRWAAVESNFCKPGSGVEVTITPRPGGGSHVDAVWHREPHGPKGAVIVSLLRLMGPVMFARAWRTVLDRHAAGEVAAA